MKDLLAYFQQYYQARCLGDITWAHAVNSQERLQRFLNDPQTMMLEVDVIISSNGEAVLAHPPATDSDLSFAAFVRTMVKSRQGIKLDFKDPEILIPCLTELRENNLSQPVLLNAGILQGNGGHKPKFSAPGFLALCKNLYPRGILSPDWTSDGSPYTQQMVEEMLAVCQGIAQITFPVNARLLPTAWQHISRLTEPDGYSLTIWDGKPIDESLLRWLQERTDPTKTCYDCLDKHNNRLRWW
jgi:hypothetical protein